MKRIQLFEFEDFDWLPGTIRAGITNLLIVFHKLMGTADVLSQLIMKVREKHNFDQIVDLGSGSGGAMLESFEKINEALKDDPLSLLMTDLYPNKDVVDVINNQNLSNIKYKAESVNASNLEDAPSGLKTMIASFHHMNPDVAKQILKSAEKSKQPILIYEVAKNTIPTILWWLFLPISLVILFVMSLVMTLFVRPLSLSQLFFTYLMPIIPIIYAWDGQASLIRTYTFKDIDQLIGEKDESYHWEIGDALNSKGKKKGYYIIGYPN